jgi:hypothetical protein
LGFTSDFRKIVDSKQICLPNSFFLMIIFVYSWFLTTFYRVQGSVLFQVLTIFLNMVFFRVFHYYKYDFFLSFLSYFHANKYVWVFLFVSIILRLGWSGYIEWFTLISDNVGSRVLFRLIWMHFGYYFVFMGFFLDFVNKIFVFVF